MTFENLSAQLVDSKLASTRVFWRKKLGYCDEVAADERPLAVVLADDALAQNLQRVAVDRKLV